MSIIEPPLKDLILTYYLYVHIFCFLNLENISSFLYLLSISISFLCILLLTSFSYFLNSLPYWVTSKESTYQCRRLKRHWFDPWVGTIPWRMKWQLTPVFLLGKSQGQRRLQAIVHGIAKESVMT